MDQMDKGFSPKDLLIPGAIIVAGIILAVAIYIVRVNHTIDIAPGMIGGGPFGFFALAGFWSRSDRNVAATATAIPLHAAFISADGA
jgi:hypothetical protein